MSGEFIPDDYNWDLVIELMDVVIIGDEVVVNSGACTIVLDALSALETGRRLILAAEEIQSR